MKKLSYILGCCVALFSCTREIEKIEPETIEYPNVAEVNDLPTNIPSTLIANLAAEDDADTKTAYVDSKSKWVLGDRVCLLYVDDLDTPTRQGWIAYSVTGLENNGRMATFTIVSGQDEKITALSSYHSTGVAIYPSNAARPYTSNTEAIDGDFSNKPFITIQSTQTGNYADVVMLGKTAVVDGSTLTVDFKTAMSILKVSVSDIPAEAAKFQLYSSDADVYPTGDFLIDINADAPLELTKDSYHTWGGGYHSGSQAITINRTSEWDDGTQDFYLNVPTGSYSAGSITLKLLDGSDNLLMEKPIKSSFTFARNKMITGINLAAEWTTLGTGKFIDNFLWHFMNVANSSFDEVGYVDVTIQQNIENSNEYRVLNPYAPILTAIGATQDASHDDYLEFTIVDASTVDFVTTNTGYDSGNGIVRLEDIDGSYNKVVLGTAGSPQIVQLAPKYNSDGTFLYTRNTRDNLIRIAFPGVYEEHCGSVSIPKSDLSTGVNYTNTAYKITVYASSSSLYSFYVNQGAQSLPATCSSAWDASGTKTTGNMGVTSALTTPGPHYIFWTTWDTTGTIVYFQGCKRFYYLTPEAVTNYIGEYDITYTTGNTTLTLDVSDNPAKGNIMLTEIAGITGKIYGAYTGGTNSLNLVFTNTYNIPFTTNTYVYSANSNLNLCLGYTLTSQANYDNHAWDVICWNAGLTVEAVGSSTTTYNYVRGDKK